MNDRRPRERQRPGRKSAPLTVTSPATPRRRARTRILAALTTTLILAGGIAIAPAATAGTVCPTNPNGLTGTSPWTPSPATPATGTDWAGCNLRYAILGSAALSLKNLTGADLTGAILARALLDGADLTNANLTGADLANAYIANTILTGAFNCGVAAYTATLSSSGVYTPILGPAPGTNGVTFTPAPIAPGAAPRITFPAAVCPGTPTAVAGNAQATVTVGTSAPASLLTVTATPGGRTCTIAASAPSGAIVEAPATIVHASGFKALASGRKIRALAANSCTVTGLTNGTSYTFAASWTYVLISSRSSVSNTVTPAAPTPAPAPAPEPEPEPTPTPTPTPTTTPVTNLDPIPNTVNPNIPTGGVPPGGSVYLVNGVPGTVTSAPAPGTGTGPKPLNITGPGFTVQLAGRGDVNDPLGLTDTNALILQSDQTTRSAARWAPSKSVAVAPVAAASGSGFKPTTAVKFYLLPATYMGELPTDTAGNFTGTVPVPPGLAPGNYTLQMNGYAPDGAVRSLSIGVIVKPAAPATRQAKTTVYFESSSATLTDQGKAALNALAKKTGKNATRTASIGYVQPTSSTDND